MWRELDHEIPPPIHEGPADQEKELAEVAEILASEVAFVAEEDGSPVGFALVRRRNDALATLTDLYVRQDARRSGVATELMREVLTAVDGLGIAHLDLEVLASNTVARSLYGRWGFRDEVVVMTQSVADLEARLGGQDAASFGSIHVQSDDLSAVEQAVRQFVPRLPGGSRGSVVAPPRNGWIGVYDDVCDRSPEMLRRLAREISDRMGAVVLLLGVERDELVRMILFERGSIVDEYLSVPEFYGPLPPGDVVGLAANPTVVEPPHGRGPRGRAPDRPDGSRSGRPASRTGAPRGVRGRARGRGLRSRLGGRARSRRRGPGGPSMKVLLLHSWPQDERMWERQVALLEDEGFEPEAPRLYGRGASIDGWAAQILRDSDDPFVAVGASMGGYCALALARREPERVVGMLLAGARADADSWDRRRYREAQIAELRTGGGQPPVLPTDPTAEDLAVAQEAMRDRLDLTGIVVLLRRPAARVCRGPRRPASRSRRRARSPRARSGDRSRSSPTQGTSSRPINRSASMRSCWSSSPNGGREPRGAPGPGGRRGSRAPRRPEQPGVRRRGPRLLRSTARAHRRRAQSSRSRSCSRVGARTTSVLSSGLLRARRSSRTATPGHVPPSPCRCCAPPGYEARNYVGLVARVVAGPLAPRRALTVDGDQARGGSRRTPSRCAVMPSSTCCGYA